MKVVKIEKKDIWVTIEFSAEHLHYLKMLFDHAKIEFDGEEEPEMVQATEYLNDHFYAFLKYFEDHGHNFG
jgi:hypothetical protein